MEPVKRDMELLSNSMATYAHIKANPETFALYFTMGVCLGLLMALCLLVAGIACRTRRHRHSGGGSGGGSGSRPAPSPERRRLKESSEEEEEEEEDEEEDEVDQGVAEEDGEERDMSRVSAAPRSESGGTLRSVDVFASAEELEKARRLEERERIVREIWRNGQPDVLDTGTGTIGRAHYH
ncbi:Protein eva-1 B [Liparis tanakae]|uniref:Protein eva-1 B n=1 Tax=Liparis tanakae TaxID=230148 RepID=A0A4Z2GVK3_9TELE|nr:Protein eva-1 B [Liparis tanakae]